MAGKSYEDKSPVASFQKRLIKDDNHHHHISHSFISQIILNALECRNMWEAEVHYLVNIIFFLTFYPLLHEVSPC